MVIVFTTIIININIKKLKTYHLKKYPSILIEDIDIREHHVQLYFVEDV